MKNESIKTINKRTLFLTFIAIIILIIAAGYYFYQIEENSIRKQQFNELSAIAQLKTNQIIQWRSERLSEAGFFSTNQTFIQNTASLLAGRNKKLLEGYFAKTLLPIEHNHGYSNIYLVSTKNRVLFSLNKNIKSIDIDSITNRDIDSAIANRKIIFSDFLFSANHKIIHLNIIAPVLGKNKTPIAALIFRILPNDYLYPLIRQWPIPSKTSETLIVRKDGDNVLFLNELRYTKSAALNLRLPLTRTDISEVKGVLGYKGIIEGIDYRGVITLADIRPIPGTTWVMVSKVDQSEIYSELHFRAVVISIMIFVLIFSLGVGLVWFYYLRQRNIYKTLWQTQEEFRTTLYSIGDAVITTDKSGIVKHINHVAEHLTGWNEAEAKGKPLLHVFKIINEDSRKIVENPIKKVLSEGLVVGLANHTLLISKDGKEIPIADSGAPIKNEDNKIIGVVIVFRDQTDERLARKALEVSERKFRHTFELASIGKSLTFLDGKIVDVNDAFCKMLGYSREELSKLNYADITFEEDLFASKEAIRCLLAGEKESYRLEKKYIKKDGTFIWADVSTMLFRNS
ncbi:MAG: PAS domain-containing protein, partial [Ignavibacteriaceae bacterium]